MTETGCNMILRLTLAIKGPPKKCWRWRFRLASDRTENIPKLVQICSACGAHASISSRLEQAKKNLAKSKASTRIQINFDRCECDAEADTERSQSTQVTLRTARASWVCIFSCKYIWLRLLCSLFYDSIDGVVAAARS